MSVASAVRAHTDELVRWLRTGSPEADAPLNRAARGVIEAMRVESGSAWLVDVNVGTWTEWDGAEAPRNFCATHVLPRLDDHVRHLIDARLSAPYEGAETDRVRVDAIQDAIDAAGGQVLVWS